MTAPERVRRYDAARHRQHRAERRAVREAATARSIEQEIRDANRRKREVRTVRMPDGRTFALGAFAATGRLHVFVPDGDLGTPCMLCFGWSNDHRHTSTVRAAS